MWSVINLFFNMHKLWFRDVKIEPLNVKCIFIIWRRSMLFRRRPYIVIRELKQILLRRQRERQKSNRFRLAKQQLRTWITPFCIFLCRGCTTTTWNFLFSRFVEDVNTRQQFSFSFLNFDTLFFFNKNIFYKNIEAEICEILRIF